MGMGTVPANKHRYSVVVAIETIPNADLEKLSDIVERLACGHLGANHGATWEGTEAPLRRHAGQYRGLIGKKRLCRTCSALATQGG
jgi:hypothetical protein